MPNAISFSLAGEPNGKGRARFRRVKPKGKPEFVSTYTPEKTRNYSAALRIVAQDAMKGREPFYGPVKVLVCAMFGIPASFPKKRRQMAEEGRIYPTKKPDIDNIAKHFDALNTVVWTDDKNIVSCTVIKRYSEIPELKIRVEEI
jgi:Holliday junction resolvase RusA-like endonuclease